jgi:hypothetical protein
MGIVEYTPERTFHIGEALEKGWGQEWEGERFLIGLKLQDRRKPKHLAVIVNSDWIIGSLRVHFETGDWLLLDHAIEQFQCLGKGGDYLVKKGRKFMRGHGYSTLRGYKFQWTDNSDEARKMEYAIAIAMASSSGGKITFEIPQRNYL